MRNCLIFGSGCCGTSALTGSLAHSGVYTGLHPMGPSPQMPYGYWEDHWINRWNNELLAQACEYTGLFISPIPLDMDHSKMSFPNPVCIHRMLWYQPYALKDPRFAFTYPAWKPFLVKPTVCLVLFRNPSDFVKSALRLRLDHPVITSDTKALETMWENSYRHIFANDDGTFYYIEHDDIVDESVFPFLEKLLGYGIRRGFVRRESRSVNEACPEWLTPMYSELRLKAASRDKLLATMDEVST